MFEDVYKSKRVFITGHTGFKGSWLAFWLLLLGARVKGYALEPKTEKDHFVVAGINSQIESVIGDVGDLDSLKNEISNYKPEIVFHLAAQPLVRESYHNPVDTYQTNVMGTVNILEAIRMCDSVKSFVNVTTDKCYENVESTEGYPEAAPLGGYDPYSSSKACSEIVTSAYRRSFFNSKENTDVPLIATARAGNVIGGGDWSKDRIMTDAISSLLGNRPIEVRNPYAIRPWQHVLEPLSGYLLLASKAFHKGYNRYSGSWNFGPDPGKVFPVRTIVDKVVECWGSGRWHDTSKPNDLHEAKLLQLDITKAKKELKWEPSLEVEESVSMTVDWYRHLNEQKGNMREFSKSQIEGYCKKARTKMIEWAAV